MTTRAAAVAIGVMFGPLVVFVGVMAAGYPGLGATLFLAWATMLVVGIQLGR